MYIVSYFCIYSRQVESCYVQLIQWMEFILSTDLAPKVALKSVEIDKHNEKYIVAAGPKLDSLNHWLK